MPAKTAIAACAAIMLSFGPVAVGQDNASFNDTVLHVAAECFAAPEGTAPAAMIMLCEAAHTDLGSLILAKSGPTADETNVFRTMRAIVLTTLATAQGQVDGFRSARSCKTVEDAWLSAAYIDPAVSPAHTPEMVEIRIDVAKMVGACRETFAPPVTVPALPGR